MSKKLTYKFCEDWFIFATDEDGQMYYLNTECWPAWASLHEDADREEDAVEKYMLPIAKRHWFSQVWRRA